MKQILQSLKNGKTELIDLPSPLVKKGQLLIKTNRSLVSLGTEKMLVEFGKASLIQKAKQQPDKIKLVLDKIKTDGLIPTIENVFRKLDQPIPLGYCNVGEVIEVGEGVDNFHIGDRVASNGPHAEFVSVPQNLVVKIPDNVSDDEACFTVIGSIGLQGVRLAKPTIGETFVVIGLGLIGLITSEILIANGCKVIGYDLDDSKVAIAKSKGVLAFNPNNNIDPVNFILNSTNKIGADGVIITASAKTNDIISQSAMMSRKRGRIILVGVVGLNISRADFYEKELSFQVSCSYGPGRYDDSYEFFGIDYPLPFVRWTEKRNFETILNLISSKKIGVIDLISEVIPLKNFSKVYENISNSNSIATILKYNKNAKTESIITISKKSKIKKDLNAAIIGSGNFTKMTLLPVLNKLNLNIKYIVSSEGLSGTNLARKFNILQSTTDYNLVLNDPQVNLVIITTRHNLHSDMVIQALKKNKNVFVEKPLALNFKELKLIDDAQKKSSATLMVGFNRRFSPHMKAVKNIVGNSPMNIIATMNAGNIPSNSWVHDLKIGGGRIIGEACHFLDLMVYLSGSEIKSVCMNSLGKNPKQNSDNCSILVKLNNGSSGVINYFSNGSNKYQKERIEVFSNGRVLINDNFKKTTGFGVKGFSSLRTKIDKGHKSQFSNLEKLLKNGSIDLIPYNEILNVSKSSIAAIESLKIGGWVDIQNLKQ